LAVLVGPGPHSDSYGRYPADGYKPAEFRAPAARTGRSGDVIAATWVTVTLCEVVRSPAFPAVPPVLP
jgi:hypothetical protein